MPVFAYIWRYSFEMSTNAIRDLSEVTTRDRSQMLGKLKPIPDGLRPVPDFVGLHHRMGD